MHGEAGIALTESKREVMVPTIFCSTRRDLLQTSIYVFERLAAKSEEHETKVYQRTLGTVLDRLKHPPNQCSIQASKNAARRPRTLDAFTANHHGSIKVYCKFVSEHHHVGLVIDPKVLTEVIS